MRSAVRPSIRSVGTRSMKAISSSMLTYSALLFWSMIISENRCPLFGIMLPHGTSL
jgi:hypothetical protein